MQGTEIARRERKEEPQREVGCVKREESFGRQRCRDASELQVSQGALVERERKPSPEN